MYLCFGKPSHIISVLLNLTVADIKISHVMGLEDSIGRWPLNHHHMTHFDTGGMNTCSRARLVVTSFC